jgi:uncharacterized protein (TIGR02284 family)
MKRSPDKIVAALNHLIETCKDGQHGFRTAAAAVYNRDLRALFKRYATQRAKFASELQAEVRRHGGQAGKTGTLMAAVHRRWMDFKSTVLGHSDAAAITECERGEDAALKAYEAVQNDGLPPDVQALVSRQHGEIQEAHDRIRSLEVEAVGK